MPVYFGGEQVSIVGDVKIGGKYDIQSIQKDDGTQKYKITTLEQGGEIVEGTLNIDKNGVYDVTRYADVNVDIAGVIKEFLVQVIDYDGTVLKNEYLNTGDIFELPEPPIHDKLVFQEWSCVLDIVDNKITVEDHDILIGPIYTTASGLSEFDIELNPVVGLDVELYMNGVKDWGDGTSDTENTHTYSDYGNYIITCDGDSNSGSKLFGTNCCISARLGSNFTTIGQDGFYNQTALKYVTIPNSVIDINPRAFSGCNTLKSIILPGGVSYLYDNCFAQCYSLQHVIFTSNLTYIGSQCFYQCYSLTSIIIPQNVTQIGSDAFYYCQSLNKIVIKDGVSQIGSSAFYNCCNLKSVHVPQSVSILNNSVFYGSGLQSIDLSHNNFTLFDSSIFYRCYALKEAKLPTTLTTIPNQCFYQCYSITKLDFTDFTSVPTLSNTSAFYRINSFCKIYVPDNLYDDWIIATNWTEYADYIYKASEMI